MADLNLKAKEFVPSWLKKPTSAATTTLPEGTKPTQAPAPAPATRTAAVSPAQIPWKAPVAASAAVAAPQPAAAKRSHMNPNAMIFEPKFAQSATPKQAPVHVQWPAATGKSPKLAAVAAAPHLLPPSNQPITSSTKKPATLVSLPARLSDAEILAISKTSSLKPHAAVFMPGQRGNHSKHLIGKPSPLTLTPASPDTEMLLADAWCLYCLCNSVTKAENYDPTLIFRIDSVPTFWKTTNNLPEPTELSPPATMYLFRDDIYPKWEDPKNVAGGVWKIRVDRDKVDSVWLVLACRTIGESWLKEHRNTINGIVLKVREKGFFVEIWVTERRDQFPTDLMSAFEGVLPSFLIDFYTHEEIQNVMKELGNPKGGKNAKKGGKKK